ncbi:MAG TPA: thermonuclease family protein [Acidimicrobiales bacterium]|nr:thermonuclease family protein [Acidimicrobiales bacterium]
MARATTTYAGAALVVVLAVVCVYRFGTGGREAGGDGSKAAGSGSVVEVIDGDTLVVRLGGSDEHLRLIGIDTPESVATDRPNECYGKEASARLAALVPPGTEVRVERDVEPRDRYDRLLGYLYRAGDGLFVNQDLVAAGFAEAKAYRPNTTFEPQFEAAEAQARNARSGLWSACGSPDVPL